LFTLNENAFCHESRLGARKKFQAALTAVALPSATKTIKLSGRQHTALAELPATLLIGEATPVAPDQLKATTQKLSLHIFDPQPEEGRL
jgi:hypothetical protein